MNENKEIYKVQLSAINPILQVNIEQPTQESVRGKDFVKYGDNNTYPEYITSLVKDCSTLSSIIYGSADFVVGNDVISNVEFLNKKKETVRDVIYKCAVDYYTFGGFYLQILKDAFGNVSEIYHVDYRYMRSNEKNDVFFYSTDWSKSFGRVQYLVYPKFISGVKQQTSILYVKNPMGRDIYANPIWQSAIKSVVIENKINEFHLNSISNGFSGSYIVNFNNGVPNDQIKDEIEDAINEKFAGSENAGRILISFNDNKDRQVEVVKLDVDDFGEKYNTLAKRSREQIFSVFGATPALFGIMTETTGFSSQEFNEAFKLYNKTRIQPLQTTIIDTITKILPNTNIEIKPFDLQ